MCTTRMKLRIWSLINPQLSLRKSAIQLLFCFSTCRNIEWCHVDIVHLQSKFYHFIIIIIIIVFEILTATSYDSMRAIIPLRRSFSCRVVKWVFTLHTKFSTEWIWLRHTLIVIIIIYCYLWPECVVMNASIGSKQLKIYHCIHNFGIIFVHYMLSDGR